VALSDAPALLEALRTFLLERSARPSGEPERTPPHEAVDEDREHPRAPGSAPPPGPYAVPPHYSGMGRAPPLRPRPGAQAPTGDLLIHGNHRIADLLTALVWILALRGERRDHEHAPPASGPEPGPAPRLDGYVVVLDGGSGRITSPPRADSFTAHNLSPSFVRVTVVFVPGPGATPARGNLSAIIAPGAVYSAAFAGRGVIEGLAFDVVALPAATAPASALAPVVPGGPVNVLVAFTDG
jgi:hypothetical protein